MTPDSSHHHVLIAGGGVAGLEALVALHALAGDRVSTTLLSPGRDFCVRAMTVGQPFLLPGPRRYPIDDICADHHARHLTAALATVDAEHRLVHTDEGQTLTYDSLLVSVGARVGRAFPGTTMFAGEHDLETIHGIMLDVEQGYARSVVFLVPPGTSWALPVYEFAVMLAEHASGMCMDDLEITIVTPEHRPLELFGDHASDTVEGVLRDHRIRVLGDAYASAVEGRRVIVAPNDVAVEAERVVSLPRLHGPAIAGLPRDEDGFLPVDEFGCVPGCEGVFGAGDGVGFPIKQGGLAAEQADAAARSIAARAGSPVTLEPFVPTLHGKLLLGRRTLFLRNALAGGAGDDASESSETPLWWPPTKVATWHLTPYLETLDARLAQSAPAGVG
jgi:sulfide:quinone oxidoreductase